MSRDLTITVHGSGIAVSPKSYKLMIVGFRNHHHFLIFILALISGIALFDYLSVACESSTDFADFRHLGKLRNARTRTAVQYLRDNLSSRSFRPILARCCLLGHSPTHMDIPSSGQPLVANLSTDDHIRNLESGAIWIHGRTRWCFIARTEWGDEAGGTHRSWYWAERGW